MKLTTYNLQTQRVPFGATTRKKAFTLIELLVVCAIIGILATVVIVNLTGAKENSKVASAVSQLNTVRKAAELYRIDTRQWPATCRSGGTDLTALCTVANDPFKVNVSSLSGWNGPYFENGISTMVHPWGGAVVYLNNVPAATPSIQKIVLDDDRVGFDSNDSQRNIPASALLKIDKIMDDDNLTTGSILQTVGIGEIYYWFPTN